MLTKIRYCFVVDPLRLGLENLKLKCLLVKQAISPSIPTGLELHKDGWIRDITGKLMLWIPPDDRDSINIKGGVCQIIDGRERYELDLDSLLCGERWIEGWMGKDGGKNEPD